MRSVYFALILALLVWCVPAVVQAAGGPQPRIALPLRITQDPGQDLTPVVAVDGDGRAYLAWKRLTAESNTVEIYLAQSPDWRVSLTTSFSTPHPEQVGLSLQAERRARLAWSQPMTSTQTIYRSVSPRETALQPWSMPLHQRSAFAMDGQGRLHTVWVQGNTIHYGADTQDLTVTLPISPGITVGEISFALDHEGKPYLAWSSQGPSGAARGITYASLVSPTSPVAVTMNGHDPQLKVGPSGRVHLFWLADEGLYYANSQDWAMQWLIVPGVTQVLGPGQKPFALAVGPRDVVHLIWFQGQALWYANSADWQCSKMQIAALASVSGLNLMVDERGGPHLTWAALYSLEGDDPGENWDIYYLDLSGSDLQLGVLYPQGGEMLTDDGLVRAEANLAASSVLRVEFYLQAENLLQASSQEDGAFISLGIDRDGEDGWSAPLSIATLDSTTRYRAMALGTDTQGRIAQALGNWFTVQPPHRPWAWVEPSESVASGANASVSALLGSSVPLQRLDLYLAPLASDGRDDPQASTAGYSPSQNLWPQFNYVGSYELPSNQRELALRWQQIAYDSRRLADGAYRALVMVTDRSGQRDYGFSPLAINLANASFPSVDVLPPEEGAVISEVLRISAQASDLDGLIRRVDFYAERRQRLLVSRYRGQDYTLEKPDLAWLGSDADGSDGWSVSLPVREALDGDDWTVRAVAYDDQGLSTSVRSTGTFTIVGRNRPVMRLLSPSADSALYGLTTVDARAIAGAQYLRQADVYVESLDGVLGYLGQMTRTVTSRWVYAWDTRAFADGHYRLVVVGSHTDGRRSLLRSAEFILQNERTPYNLVQPNVGEVLSGPATIRIQSMTEISPVAEVKLYYRDRTGQLGALGPGTWKGKEWCAPWDTSSVLDGPYDLVASIADPAGRVHFLGRKVVVRNTTPTISWAQSWRDIQLRGARQISWRTQHPTAEPLSVTAEYSPDAGAHWIRLATNIPMTQSFMWRSELYPDSARALLRLTATDGLHRAQVTSDPFRVDNTNEAPQAHARAPRSGGSYSGSLRIAWDAQDIDDNTLTIDLDYRRGAGSWSTIAHQLANTGYYVWDTEGLLPAVDYELRLTARDAMSATASVTVPKITLMADHALAVHLLWPEDGVRLQREGIILWQATVEDKDELLIDLYYSDNAGQTWLPLAEGIPNTGYYVWQVSYLPMGTQYRVRVVARDGAFQVSDEGDGLFAIGANTQPQVALTSPMAGSNASGTQVVSWSACDPDRGPLRVSLMLRGSAQSAWKPLIENVPDDGFYLWDTTAYVDGDYSLRVVITDGQAIASATLPAPVSVTNRSNDPPQVALLSPRGGESWAGVREVIWQAWDDDDKVITATLSISHDGGQTWSGFATLDARTGRYLWDTRAAPPGRDYLLRIVVSDRRTFAQDTSAGVFHLRNRQGHPPYIAFVSPDTAGKLLPGDTVSWIAEDSDGDPLTISLALQEDNGLAWEELANDLLPMGGLALDSSRLTIGPSYRLRLRASDGLYRVEVLSTPFRLARGGILAGEQPPELLIDAPSAGAEWSATHEIRWRISGFADQEPRISLDISSDGGQSWSSLATDLRRMTAYPWDTSRVADGYYLLRVTAYEGKTRISQTSESVKISNPGGNIPSISLLSPRQGELWSGVKEVRWRAFDPDGDRLAVGLEYSLDLGATWQTLAKGLTDMDTHIWDTTSMPNCDHVRLRATVNDGRFTATVMSDGVFNVYNPHGLLVALLTPQGGECWSGSQRIVWRTVQGTDRRVAVRLELSLDQGRTWRSLATDLSAEGDYLWDTRRVPGGGPVWLRVVASDGLQSAIDYTQKPVVIRGNPELNLLPLYLP